MPEPQQQDILMEEAQVLALKESGYHVFQQQVNERVKDKNAHNSKHCFQETGDELVVRNGPAMPNSLK